MQNRVRELRTAAGLTQQQLAEQVRVLSRIIISLEKRAGDLRRWRTASPCCSASRWRNAEPPWKKRLEEEKYENLS